MGNGNVQPSDPPELDSIAGEASAGHPADKENHIEIYAPRLIEHFLGFAPLPADKLKKYLASWNRDVRGDYQRWRQSSCNWDAMLDAVWILHDPSGERPRADGTKVNAVQKWTDWLNWQLGLAPPPSSQPKEVRFFGGRETLSNTYEPFRWGSVAAVQLWASGQGNHPPNNPKLAELARRYSQANCLLMAASAAPTPAVNVQRGSAGLFYNGPYMPQAGMRATPAHAGQDCRGVLFALACAIPLPRKHSKREEWPAKVARKLDLKFQIDPGVANRIRRHIDGDGRDPQFIPFLEAQLKGLSLFVEVFHMRWPGVRACYTPKQCNNLTPCMFGSVYHDDSKTVDLLSPFNRGFADRNHPFPGDCSIVAAKSGPGRVLRAVARYPVNPSVVEASIPQGPPLYVFVEGREGCKAGELPH